MLVLTFTGSCAGMELSAARGSQGVIPRPDFLCDLDEQRRTVNGVLEMRVGVRVKCTTVPELDYTFSWSDGSGKPTEFSDRVRQRLEPGPRGQPLTPVDLPFPGAPAQGTEVHLVLKTSCEDGESLSAVDRCSVP